MTTASHADRVAEVGKLLAFAVEHQLVMHGEIEQAARLMSAARFGPLSATQARQAHRILQRCADALTRLGLEIPEEPLPEEPAPRPALATAGPAPVVRMRADGRIGVRAPFQFRGVLKALPGARGEKANGQWEWHYPASAASAGNVPNALPGSGAQFSPRVTALAEEYQRRYDALAVLDEESPLPVLDAASLFKSPYAPRGYQARAIDFSTRVSASLLAIPMGGGKTMCAIGAVNRLEKSEGETKRVVIVCPSKVRGVWPREVRKFSAQRWHIVDGMLKSRRGSGQVSMKLADRLHQAEQCLFDCACGAPVHAAVINYEAFAHEPWESWRPRQRLDVAIYDEAHRLKAPTGKISKALARWVDFTIKRVGLTGTPIPNAPLDVFGLFRALDPGIFGVTFTAFRANYAITNPHIAQQVVGYKNVADLAEKFYSITHLPTVDLKLPAVTNITRECELEPKAAKIYRDLDEQLWADLSEFTGTAKGTELCRDLEEQSRIADLSEFSSAEERTITPANVMVRLLRLQQLTGGTVVDDEGEKVRVSRAKQDLLSEVLDEVGCIRSADDAPGHQAEPVIVFCRFRSDLDAVQETARKAGLSYAEISGRRHDGLTADSEMDPDADIVGVQIQSGGTGVDLTRARVGIWYSLGYSLADYLQAIKRMDRPGQTRPVVFVHLLAADTADYEVYASIDAKQSVVTGVLSAHGVDAGELGFRAPVADQAEERLVNGAAVAVPFEQLIRAENARLGAPGSRRPA